MNDYVQKRIEQIKNEYITDVYSRTWRNFLYTIVHKLNKNYNIPDLGLIDTEDKWAFLYILDFWQQTVIYNNEPYIKVEYFDARHPNLLKNVDEIYLDITKKLYELCLTNKNKVLHILGVDSFCTILRVMYKFTDA